MLIYLGRGARRYAEYPIEVSTRGPWEFQAVVKGSIAYITPEGVEPLRGRRLWLSAPQCAHGWSGEPGSAAEVVVFHFQYIPPVLERLIGSSGRLEMDLSAEQCRRLRALSRQALPYWEKPSAGMTLCHEHILMELSLMLYEAVGDAASPDRPAQRVEEALRAFGAHMKDSPTQEWIAASVGSSPAHLRRLFHAVMHASPKKVFDQLRFQRAMQLMLEPGAKMETVGLECGFGSASAFSRAFKNKIGVSPEGWRASVLTRR